MGQYLGKFISGPSPFNDLPVDCISKIISFTSPRDACVSSSVSKTFQSAANSDCVWEKFIPSDYESLYPPSIASSLKKDLYLMLCNHFLIHGGTKSFWIEKVSGKKCVMLAPSELRVACVSLPSSVIYSQCWHWHWHRMHSSRFEKIPEVIEDCDFKISGNMNTQILSPRTHYSAYLVYKLMSMMGYGLRDLLIQVGVMFDNLQVGVGFKGQEKTKKFIMKSEMREDGWIEAEIGDFFNEGGLMGFDEIEVSIDDINSPNSKRGLIIHGIEFRPRT